MPACREARNGAGVTAIEEAGEVNTVRNAGENLPDVIVDDEVAVLVIDGTQRLVFGIVVFVGPGVGELRAMTGVLEHDHVPGAGLLYEVAKLLQDPFAGRLLVAEYGRLRKATPNE